MAKEKELRDISTPEKLSDYVGNLNLNLPGSMFRRKFLENPESDLPIKELEHTKKMAESFGDNIYSNRFLNTTYRRFYADIDNAIIESGYTLEKMEKIHHEFLSAMRSGNLKDRDRVKYEFCQVLLTIHDNLIERGYWHYEVVA